MAALGGLLRSRREMTMRAGPHFRPVPAGLVVVELGMDDWRVQMDSAQI